MFSKNRSSRQKDKNRNASSSASIDTSRMSGSVNRSQEQLMYGENTSPARNPNYAVSYDNGSLERPQRGRAMSDGSPAEFAISSPLDFPLEHLQSFNVTYGLNPSQRTFIDSRSIPRHTPLKSLSPTHSRTISSSRTNGQNHARACSTSSLGNSMRDRSLDRMERENVFLGESALDKHFEQIQYNMQMDNHLNRNIRYNTTGRDRSLDRDYPHMGARSLERDHHSANRSRSTDRGADYNYPSATLPSIPLLSHSSNMQPEQSSHEFRNSLVFEMQVQISDLHKEVGKLQKDLDQTREKLSSSMNSIKTFWSPELKKERAVRKEEAARCNLMTEQLKVIQTELKKQKDQLKEYEGNSFLKESQRGEGLSNNASLISQELSNLKQERDLQCREMVILKKTIEELEIRIESQRQTLDARDESIKKLLEMLHSKGINVTKVEDEKKELETLQVLLKEEEQKRKMLELCVNEKDVRISCLEKEILQYQLHKSGESESPADQKLHTLLEARIQALKDELSKKDTQIVGLQMKVDTAEHQLAEREAYMGVLKEQTASKEKQITMLQSDIEGLQERLKVKDGTIERKNKETAACQLEKRKLELEIMELRDQLEIKASRVGILQRKIEGLEDTIREKEDQLSQARVRLTSTFTESSNDSTLSNLEEGLAEKEKQIERLKDQREQMEKEHHEELDVYIKKVHDMKLNIETLQKEFTSKQTEICELREQQAEMRSIKFEQDGKIRRLECDLQEKLTDFQRITLELEESKEKVLLYEKEKSELLLKKKEEGQPANLNKQECKQLQAEIDKLQEMVKEAEAERNEKDNEIKDLQEVVKEYKQKMGTLKRSQQTEKKKNAQLLEEARKREDSMTDESSHLSVVIKKSNDRVEELEEALRQSVIITAEREMAMADLQTQLEDSKMAIKDMNLEIENLQLNSQEYEHKLTTLLKEVSEKDSMLNKLKSERQKHLEEVYELKQEALQAVISEKDSTLAVLEMTSTKNQKNMEEIDKLIQDKHKLQAQLREVTAKRMNLLSDQKSDCEREEEMCELPFICTSESPVEKTNSASSPLTYSSIGSPQDIKTSLITDEKVILSDDVS
ncbi:ERC protein 2 [Bulinus truncatus]|nr:ERC protein 2 [Bulinus truncatus]